MQCFDWDMNGRDTAAIAHALARQEGLRQATALKIINYFERNSHLPRVDLIAGCVKTLGVKAYFVEAALNFYLDVPPAAAGGLLNMAQMGGKQGHGGPSSSLDNGRPDEGGRTDDACFAEAGQGLPDQSACPEAGARSETARAAAPQTAGPDRGMEEKARGDFEAGGQRTGGYAVNARRCALCGRIFEQVDSDCCCRSHAKKYAERERQRRAWLSWRPGQSQGLPVCSICGAHFVPARINQSVCSLECRKARRQREGAGS